MNKKILLSAIILVFILISIPVGVYLVKREQEIRMLAAPATELSLSPSTISKNPGEEFSLAVNINTHDNRVSAADVVLTFSSTQIVATNVVQGTFLSTVLVAGDISPGNVRFAYGNLPAKSGEGILATVYFEVQDGATPGSTQISFSDLTQVAGEGETGNVLASTSPATITILAAEPTSTPTPTPTPTPGGGTPTPTPTPTPGGGTPTPTPTSGVGGLEPTATPTPTPTTAAGTTPTPTPTIPVTGTFETTISIFGLGFLLLVFGIALVLL